MSSESKRRQGRGVSVQHSPADRTRKGDAEQSTTKTVEAQALMLELDQKSQRMRALGLLMLGVVCIGVIIAVILGTLIFMRQSSDRAAEARRREQQAEVGNQIISDIYGRLNNVDKNVSELVGKEPLPPLVIPTTTPTTVRRTTTTTARRATTTTARPTTATTSAPTTTTAPSSTTTAPPTTTQPPNPETCVGPVCLRSP